MGGDDKEDEIGKNMIEVAKSHENLYFVYHSVLHSLLEDLPHHRKKQLVEKMLVDSGLKYAIIQPTVFMQMLMPAVYSVKNGGPAPQKCFTDDSTYMNFIDMRDFADAAAIIISDEDYAYGTYELAGPINYSPSDLEQAFSKAAHRTDNTVYLDDEPFLQRPHNSPDSYSGQTLLRMFAHYNTHSFLGNDRVFSMIVGRKPNTLLDWISSCM